jgi:hypothetical protein
MSRSIEGREVERLMWLVGLFITLILVAISLAGCATEPAGQGVTMPQFEPAPVAIEGALELSDGTVVDLGAGVVLAGADGLYVRRFDLDVKGGVLADKSPILAAFEYHSQQAGEVWTRCLDITLDVGQWRPVIRAPLSASCGTPGLVRIELAGFPGDDGAAPDGG